MARCGAPTEGEVGSILARVIARKSEVEYEDRSVTLKEARELAKWVRRLDALVRGDVLR